MATDVHQTTPQAEMREKLGQHEDMIQKQAPRRVGLSKAQLHREVAHSTSGCTPVQTLAVGLVAAAVFVACLFWITTMLREM